MFCEKNKKLCFTLYCYIILLYTFMCVILYTIWRFNCAKNCTAVKFFPTFLQLILDKIHHLFMSPKETRPWTGSNCSLFKVDVKSVGITKE